MKLNAILTFFLYGAAISLLGKWVLFDGEKCQISTPKILMNGCEVIAVWQEKSGMLLSEDFYLNEFVIITFAIDTGKIVNLKREIPRQRGVWFREATIIEGGIQLRGTESNLDIPIPGLALASE
jgi:hypothetical protein